MPGRLKICCATLSCLWLLGCGSASKEVSLPASPAIQPGAVVLLGGIHEKHKGHRYYSTETLLEIFAELKPDIVMVELPTDWAEGDTIKPERRQSAYEKDGSEGDVSFRYCLANDVPCLLYDIPGRNDFYREQRYFDREPIHVDALFERLSAQQPLAGDALALLFSAADLCSQTTAEVTNSTACDGLHRAKLELFARAENTYPDLPDAAFAKMRQDFWQKRNQYMADTICKTFRENPTKRIVVTMGATHRYILHDLLSTSCKGIPLREFWELVSRGRDEVGSKGPSNAGFKLRGSVLGASGVMPGIQLG